MTQNYEKYIDMGWEEALQLKDDERKLWLQAMREKCMKDNLRFAIGIVTEERERLMNESHLSSEETYQIAGLAVGLLQNESFQNINVNIET